MQVTSLLPSFTALLSVHVTWTTVPGSTGNCFVVSTVLIHSVFSPVQIGAVEVLVLSKKSCILTFSDINVKDLFPNLVDLRFHGSGDYSIKCARYVR